MATHSSILAWRIPGTGEPGGLPSMGSQRVGHDCSDLAAAAVGEAEGDRGAGQSVTQRPLSTQGEPEPFPSSFQARSWSSSGEPALVSQAAPVHILMSCQ